MANGIPTADEGFQMVRSYERLQARELAVRAGWATDEEEFDTEMPPLDPGLRNYHEASRGGMQARVVLRQLSAWAAGHQEAFELEERLKADAAAKLAAAKPPLGFAQGS